MVFNVQNLTIRFLNDENNLSFANKN
jgi:hypothetical protein